MTDPRQFLELIHKNLCILLEREAKYAGNAPLELLNQIEDHRTAIELTEQRLCGKLGQAEWQENLKPLPLGLNPASVTNNIYNYFIEPPASMTSADLAAAAEQLDTMPLDAVPGPACLPDGSRLPLHPNSLFVGRDRTLMQLANLLKGAGPDGGQVVVVHGIGGVGKTQLAGEFAHRYGQYFAGGVFWLNFAEPDGIATQVANYGRKDALKIRPDFDRLSLDEQTEAVLLAWQSSLPRLLIFDNCESKALLKQWKPITSGCRILVTSRRAMWGAELNISKVPLGVLSPQDSVAFLRKYRPDLPPNTPDFQSIANDLGHLPLALHLAGRFLKRYKNVVAPAEYLAELRSGTVLDHLDHQPLIDDEEETSPTNHELGVARTFSIIYKRLANENETNGLSLKLLGRAACCASGEPIPRALLTETVARPSEQLDRRLLIADALTQLVNSGLLETGQNGVLRLHRLVQVYTIQANPDDTVQPAVEEALLRQTSRWNSRDDLPQLLPLEPHLRAVLHAPQAQQNERVANLCDEFGYYLLFTGQPQKAQPYHLRALAIRRELGDRHGLGRTLGNLGNVASALDQTQQAYKFYKHSFAISREVKDRTNQGVTLMHLGNIFRSWDQPNRAIICYKIGLSISTAVNDQRSMMTILHSLGHIYRQSGSYRQAIDYHSRGLAINQQVGNQRSEWVGLGDLGDAYLEAGQAEAALKCYTQSLEISREMHDRRGECMDLSRMGNVHRLAGQKERALEYYEQSFRLNGDLEDNHGMWISLINLGDTRQEISAGAAETFSYYRQALDLARQMNHWPNQRISLDRLADAYRAVGQYRKALTCYHQALKASRQVGDRAGEGMALADIGMVLIARHKIQVARCCLISALEIFKAHNLPQTAQIQAVLAQI